MCRQQDETLLVEHMISRLFEKLKIAYPQTDTVDLLLMATECIGTPNFENVDVKFLLRNMYGPCEMDHLYTDTRQLSDNMTIAIQLLTARVIG